MLTVTNSSSDITLGYTPTDKIPYFIINTTLFIIDISKSIAEDIIGKLTAGTDFASITHITLQQYDIYRDITEYKAGLEDLFYYLIFINQNFVSDGLNIVCPNSTFLDAATAQVTASQKTITSTGNLFPSTEKSFLDSNAITEEMKGSILVSKVNPVTSIRLDITLSKSYEEIVDTPDASKNITTATELQTYYFRQHIQHDIVNFAMSRTVAKFYGAMTTTKSSDTGSMVIDIHKVVKTEDIYITTAISTGGGN